MHVFVAAWAIIDNKFELQDWAGPMFAIPVAIEFNLQWPTYNCTYYFSYCTSRSVQHTFLSKYHWPSAQMHPLMMVLSTVTGCWQPVEPYYEGFKAEVYPRLLYTCLSPGHLSRIVFVRTTSLQMLQDWWENDGPVNLYSQPFPRIPYEHPHKHISIAVNRGERIKEGKFNRCHQFCLVLCLGRS